MNDDLILDFLLDLETKQVKYPAWSTILVQLNIQNVDNFISVLESKHLMQYDFNGNYLAHHFALLPNDEISLKLLETCERLAPRTLKGTNLFEISPAFSYFGQDTEIFHPEKSKLLLKYIDKECFRYLSNNPKMLDKIENFLEFETIDLLIKLGNDCKTQPTKGSYNPKVQENHAKFFQWLEYQYLLKMEKTDKKPKMRIL